MISVTGFIPPVIQLNWSSINAQCGKKDVLLVCCVTYYNMSAIITGWVDKSTGIAVNSFNGNFFNSYLLVYCNVLSFTTLVYFVNIDFT